MLTGKLFHQIEQWIFCRNSGQSIPLEKVGGVNQIELSQTIYIHRRLHSSNVMSLRSILLKHHFLLSALSGASEPEQLKSYVNNMLGIFKRIQFFPADFFD